MVRQPGWRDVLKVPCSFLYLSELISGIIQYLVLLCLPRANTRSHHHLMLTSHSDAKSLAVSEARLSDLNPYSEDEKMILGSIYGQHYFIEMTKISFQPYPGLLADVFEQLASSPLVKRRRVE